MSIEDFIWEKINSVPFLYRIWEFFYGIAMKVYTATIADGRWKMYLNGLYNTLLVAFLAAGIGIVIGVVLAMINYISGKKGRPRVLWKILSVISNIYITIVRGTPVVLQLMLMYMVVLISLDFQIVVLGLTVYESGMLIGSITFGLNSAAYVAEIVRAGFEAVDDGQREAGRSLGLTTWQTMRYIIIPQAVRNSLPPLFNELITLVKETAVIGYLGVNDLGKVPGQIYGSTFDYLTPLIISAILYLAVVMILTLILRLVEKALKKSDRR